jgi:hypothetical protein
MKSNRRGQEEMVGFALIIIVVAVILLAFIGFSLRTGEKEPIESYEVDSFLQAMLQYTTNCTDTLQALSVQRLIAHCQRQESCLDGRNACQVLDAEAKGILEKSWPSGDGRPVKGYEMNITAGGKNIFYARQGNATLNSKGSAQYLQDASIVFKAYY